MWRFISGFSIFIALFVIFVISATFIISDKNQLSSVCPKYLQNKCDQDIDAVIAFSGGDTSSRTKEAITIFKNTNARKIIFSGANSDPKVLSDAQQMANIAKKNGILSEQILLEENAQNTHQNAQYTAKILKQNSYKKVVLTTSRYHQARAKLEIEKALKGSDIKVISAPVVNDPDWNEYWWLSKRGWYLSMSELFGIFRFYIGE